MDRFSFFTEKATTVPQKCRFPKGVSSFSVLDCKDRLAAGNRVVIPKATDSKISKAVYHSGWR
jgi:hypothetical protein